MSLRANGSHRGRRLWKAHRRARWEFRETKDVHDVPGCGLRDVLRALAPFGVTENDAKVAWLVAALYESAQIAEAFGVSRSTVTAAIGRLLRRFGLRKRGELLRKVRDLVSAAGPPAGES